MELKYNYGIKTQLWNKKLCCFRLNTYIYFICTHTHTYRASWYYQSFVYSPTDAQWIVL